MRRRHDPDLIRQQFAEGKAEHLTFAQLTECTVQKKGPKDGRFWVYFRK
jgi:hypothetical protein